MRGTVTGKEGRWVLIWIGVALIVTSVPYLVGWLRSTPDRVFGGFAFAIEDGYSYLAKMKQGADGLWLFQLPYTSEAHTPTIFYLFHLLLGKFSALTGLSAPLVYHLARLIFDAILLAVIYRFIALFTAWRPVRRIAFLLVIFSGGLGWLLILLGQVNWLDSAPIDLISPEAYTFLILYGFPHLALARAMMLLGLIALWKEPKARIRDAVLAGLCWLGMGLLVPFYVAVAGAIVLAGLVAMALAARKIDRRAVGRAAIAGLIAAPPLVYTFVIMVTDPIWKVWADRAGDPFTTPAALRTGLCAGRVAGHHRDCEDAEAARDRSETDRVVDRRAAVDLSAVQFATAFDRKLANPADVWRSDRAGVRRAARVESIALSEATDAASALFGARLTELAVGGDTPGLGNDVCLDAGRADSAYHGASGVGFSRRRRAGRAALARRARNL